jgi:hypothetical protein
MLWNKKKEMILKKQKLKATHYVDRILSLSHFNVPHHAEDRTGY